MRNPKLNTWPMQQSLQMSCLAAELHIGQQHSRSGVVRSSLLAQQFLQAAAWPACDVQNAVSASSSQSQGLTWVSTAAGPQQQEQPIEGAAVQTAGNTADVRGMRGSDAMAMIEDAMQVEQQKHLLG